MKNLLIAFLALFISSSLCAQDVIVTTSDQTISCKITKLEKDYIQFVYLKDGVYESTLIQRSEVKSFKQGFDPTIKIPKDSLPGYIDASGIRLAISGGLSYDPGRIEGVTPENFYKDLRSGYHIEIGGIYFFDRTIGVGLKYNLFKSSNSFDNVSFDNPDGEQVTGRLENKITASFIGATLATRFLGKNTKTAFFINSSFGLLHFKNEQVLVDNYEVNAKTFGTSVDLGYDVQVAKQFYLGLQLGITGGRIKKFDFESPDGTETVELPNGQRFIGNPRLDFSLGVRYTL